jgi:WD repeat-containing protein 61
MNLEVKKKFVLEGHKGSIYDLIKLDDKSFISAGSDRLAVKWNAEQLSEGTVIAQAADGIYSLCIIDEMLLIGQGSGGIHAVNLKKGKEEKLLQLHTAPVFKIAKYNSYIYSLGGEGRLCILDETFSQVKSLQLSSSKLRSIAFDPQNDIALVGCGDGSVSILDTKTLQVINTIIAHKEGFGVNVITFSPDGEMILTGSRDAHLHIYNASDLSLMKSIPAHRSAIYDIAFNARGDLFATASRDKTVKIWNTSTQEVLVRIDKENYNGHAYSVNRCLWMGPHLFTTGDDRNIMCWEILQS